MARPGLLVLAMMSALAWLPAAWAAKATVVYAGNLDGELEPCGCSAEGNLGGIRRHSSTVKALRQKDPNLVLISSGGFLVSETARDRLKSEYILKGVAALGYDAVGLQWKDLAYGEGFITSSQLPWVATNWMHANDFSRQKVIERGAAKFTVFSWLDPQSSPMKQKATEFQVVSSQAEGIAQGLARAKAAGHTTILTTTLALKQAKRLIPLDKVDILLVRAGYEKFGKPQKVGKTLVLEPGSRGMRFGQVVLDLDRKGGISRWQHTVIEMPSTVADDPGLAGWYQEYNDKVKAAYEAETALKKQHERTVSPYVGAEACKSCHVAQYQVWEGAKHAHAFERLQEVSKAFDPDCIVCHTVGFEKEGGFIDMDITPDMANVQCESCHGSGRAHVESAGKTRVPNASWSKPQICGQCHTPAHSPAFNLDTYWPRIAH